MRMKRRVPVLIAVLLIALLGFGYYINMVLIPSYKTAQANLQVKEDSLVAKREELNKVKELDALFEEIEQAANQALTALPSKKQVPYVLYQLTAIADAEGLDIGNINLNPGNVIRVQSGLEAISFNLSFTGTYLDIVDYLYKAERSLRLLNITTIALSGNNSDESTQTLLTVSMQGEAYYTPETPTR